MSEMRSQAIRSARATLQGGDNVTEGHENAVWGVILGTLGRQGNFKQLQVRLLIVIRWTYQADDVISVHNEAAVTGNEPNTIHTNPTVRIVTSKTSPLQGPHFSIHSDLVSTAFNRLGICIPKTIAKPV